MASSLASIVSARAPGSLAWCWDPPGYSLPRMRRLPLQSLIDAMAASGGGLNWPAQHSNGSACAAHCGRSHATWEGLRQPSAV